MKIVGVTVLEYSRQLDGRSWNPRFRWTERRAPLLLLEADNGLVGIGEAWCLQPAIGLILEHLAAVSAPRLLGVELADPASVSRTAGPTRQALPAAGASWVAAAAASAIEIALWDLHAKSRGQPLWRALGGKSNRVDVYASGGLYRDCNGVDGLAAEMRGHIAAGFRAVKMKVGGLPLASDLERVRAVRAAVGADAELWVDAVNQLDSRNAIRWATALAEAGATAIQAPVPFSDMATMARINGTCLPVVAGEAEHDRVGFETLMASGAVTLLQPCLGLCGGFSAATQLASRAQARSIGITPQTFGAAVLQAAALHWGAATPGVHSVEYHRFHDHLAPLLSPCLRRVADGCIALGKEPGLGVGIPQPGPQADGGEIRCHRRLSIDH
jgi:L-alanine-DL-glutamate epimerase-like enolase superfamily enzyme